LLLLLLLLLPDQALVGHFAAKGQPGRVEACVVHLPIMSLDLNQVRLWRHRAKKTLVIISSSDQY
jgi:hypothetical protein